MGEIVAVGKAEGIAVVSAEGVTVGSAEGFDVGTGVGGRVTTSIMLEKAAARSVAMPPVMSLSELCAQY